jgi:hypothetical protein
MFNHLDQRVANHVPFLLLVTNLLHSIFAVDVCNVYDNAVFQPNASTTTPTFRKTDILGYFLGWAWRTVGLALLGSRGLALCP